MFYAHPHAKADHTHVVFFQLRSNGILCKSSMHPSSHKPEDTSRRHRPPLSSFLPGEDTEDTRRRHIQEHRKPEDTRRRHRPPLSFLSLLPLGAGRRHSLCTWRNWPWRSILLLRTAVLPLFLSFFDVSKSRLQKKEYISKRL